MTFKVVTIAHTKTFKVFLCSVFLALPPPTHTLSKYFHEQLSLNSPSKPYLEGFVMFFVIVFLLHCMSFLSFSPSVYVQLVQRCLDRGAERIGSQPVL